MRKKDDVKSKLRYFRAGDRIFKQNEAWYFAAREGDQGPYSSRGQAELEARRFVIGESDGDLEHFQKTRTSTITEDDKCEVDDQEEAAATVKFDGNLALIPMEESKD